MTPTLVLISTFGSNFWTPNRHLSPSPYRPCNFVLLARLGCYLLSSLLLKIVLLRCYVLLVLRGLLLPHSLLLWLLTWKRLTSLLSSSGIILRLNLFQGWNAVARIQLRRIERDLTRFSTKLWLLLLSLQRLSHLGRQKIVLYLRFLTHFHVTHLLLILCFLDSTLAWFWTQQGPMPFITAQLSIKVRLIFHFSRICVRLHLCMLRFRN